MIGAIYALSHKGRKLTNGNTTHAYTFTDPDAKSLYGYQITLNQ